MATSRITHRRQGSDGPAQGAGGLSLVALDGRVLEEPATRKAKDEVQIHNQKAASKPAVARPPLGPRHHPSVSDRPPMTPPRVAGFSLAPAPDPDHIPAHSSLSGAAAGAAAAGPGVGQAANGPGAAGSGVTGPGDRGRVLHGRAGSQNHMIVGAAGGKGPGGEHGAKGQGAGAGSSAPAAVANLVAEGRGIPRYTPGPLPLPGLRVSGTGDPEVQGTGVDEYDDAGYDQEPLEDPRITAFRDINGSLGGADSFCSTPPALSISVLTRPDTADEGPLGPLTPCPLSPSILTLCAPGGQDNFQFATAPVGKEPKAGKAWGAGSVAEGLVDMRLCDSPRLPH